MPLKAPRLHLRNLLALVALVALLLWAVAWIWSPLNRLSSQLGPETPVYIRREAAMRLGYGIPPWETERAVWLLIRTLDDPSPRVREYAAAGLGAHGVDASVAIPHLLKLVNDPSRGVRASALGALGSIEEASGNPNPDVIPALIRALDDSDPDARLTAAEALIKLGNIRPAASVLVSAMAATEYEESCARLILLRNKKAKEILIPEFAKFVRDPESGRREAALKLLIEHGGSEVVFSALRWGLGDQDESVRQWSASKLDTLGLRASP